MYQDSTNRESLNILYFLPSNPTATNYMMNIDVSSTVFRSGQQPDYLSFIPWQCGQESGQNAGIRFQMTVQN